MIPSHYEKICDVFWWIMQYNKTVVGSILFILYGLLSNIMFDITVRWPNYLSSYSCEY